MSSFGRADSIADQNIGQHRAVLCIATGISNEHNHTRRPMTAAKPSELPSLSRRVLSLQALTILWMTVEAVVRFARDGLAFPQSVSVGFRRRQFDRATFGDCRALAFSVPSQRGTGSSDCGRVAFRVLAGFVMLTSVLNFLGYREAQRSPLGIGILLAAAVVMPWFANQKRRLGAITSSAALKADATQSALCAYMAWIALAGLLVNAIWGISWADPTAALTLTPLVLREGWIAVHTSKLGCDCCTA